MRPRIISWYSPSKGVPEKNYAFDLQFYDEIIPEVHLTSFSFQDRAEVLGDEACSNHPRGDPRVEEEDTQIGVLAEVDQGEAEPELGED